jgi:hypothetical protein
MHPMSEEDEATAETRVLLQADSTLSDTQDSALVEELRAEIAYTRRENAAVHERLARIEAVLLEQKPRAAETLASQELSLSLNSDDDEFLCSVVTAGAPLLKGPWHLYARQDSGPLVRGPMFWRTISPYARFLVRWSLFGLTSRMLTVLIGFLLNIFNGTVVWLYLGLLSLPWAFFLLGTCLCQPSTGELRPESVVACKSATCKTQPVNMSAVIVRDGHDDEDDDDGDADEEDRDDEPLLQQRTKSR